MCPVTGHRAGVIDVAVHPSAKVALSIAKDSTLFMWNLARGKISFSGKTKGSAPAAVEWSPDGSAYLLCANTNVKVSSVDGHTSNTFVHDKAVS